jgi:hypothetical protein
LRILSNVREQMQIIRLSHLRLKLDAQEKALQFYKNGCQRGIYDNMRIAVDTVFVGKERQFNRRFLQLMGPTQAQS